MSKVHPAISGVPSELSLAPKNTCGKRLLPGKSTGSSARWRSKPLLLAQWSPSLKRSIRHRLRPRRLLRNVSAFLYQWDDFPRELPSGWGYRVNRKRVRRLLRMMGLEAMRPKSGALSAANRAHPVFP